MRYTGHVHGGLVAADRPVVVPGRLVQLDADELDLVLQPEDLERTRSHVMPIRPHLGEIQLVPTHNLGDKTF